MATPDVLENVCGIFIFGSIGKCWLVPRALCRPLPACSLVCHPIQEDIRFPAQWARELMNWIIVWTHTYTPIHIQTYSTTHHPVTSWHTSCMGCFWVPIHTLYPSVLPLIIVPRLPRCSAPHSSTSCLPATNFPVPLSFPLSYNSHPATLGNQFYNCKLDRQTTIHTGPAFSLLWQPE